MRLPLPQSAFSSSLPPPLPPPCFISSTNHMVTAPSNLWGRVCKCVFLSSDLQIVPFIAFVTVKIKVPGWPVPQITESAQGATAGWEPMEGSGPCYHLYVCVCMHVCVRTHMIKNMGYLVKSQKNINRFTNHHANTVISGYLSVYFELQSHKIHSKYINYGFWSGCGELFLIYA